MLKKLMITTALTGLMIGAAAAQNSTPAQNMPANPPAGTTQYAPKADMKSSSSAQFIKTQKPEQWLASKFRGMDVVGSDNQKIGSVNDILFDKDGKIEAYVVSVGGFLGMGAKDVALAPSSFQVISGDKSKYESDKLKLSMSADQLKQAANFEPYNPPRATTGSGTGSSPRPMTPPANR
jgi:sporulation protein YlmC with PRC-barrel domain